MIYLLLKNNLHPLIVDKQDKGKYIRFLDEQDADGFTAYAKEAIKKEKARYIRFVNNEE